MVEREELTEEELDDIVGNEYGEEYEKDELDDEIDSEEDDEDEEDLDSLLANINKNRDIDENDFEEDESDDGEDLENLLTNINEVRDNHAPGKQLYQIKSDVTIEEHRAFFMHSSFFMRKWLLPMYICLPLAGTAFTSTVMSDTFNLTTTLISAVVMYAVLFALVYFRAKKKLKTMRIETPGLVETTPTTFTFCENRLLIIKKGKILKIPYNMLVNVCATKQRLFLYFDNGKGIVIKNEDVEKCVNSEEFIKYIKSRIRGKN